MCITEHSDCAAVKYGLLRKGMGMIKGVGVQKNAKKYVKMPFFEQSAER
jgi:hypothetical protein